MPLGIDVKFVKQNLSDGYIYSLVCTNLNHSPHAVLL